MHVRGCIRGARPDTPSPFILSETSAPVRQDVACESAAVELLSRSNGIESTSMSSASLSGMSRSRRCFFSAGSVVVSSGDGSVVGANGEGATTASDVSVPGSAFPALRTPVAVTRADATSIAASRGSCPGGCLKVRRRFFEGGAAGKEVLFVLSSGSVRVSAAAVLARCPVFRCLCTRCSSSATASLQDVRAGRNQRTEPCGLLAISYEL